MDGGNFVQIGADVVDVFGMSQVDLLERATSGAWQLQVPFSFVHI
jgi:hypothetical protein